MITIGSESNELQRKKKRMNFFLKNSIYPETDVTTATLSRALLSHLSARLIDALYVVRNESVAKIIINNAIN